jgi:predicted transcriptional regulator
MVDSVGATPAARKAMIRDQQRELYGTSLRSLVHGLAADYGVSQARLAEVIGISPAMLSQLVSADRIKIGDPVANMRLMLLAQRRSQVRRLTEPSEVDAVLADVARVQRAWPQQHGGRNGQAAASATDLVRGAATPQELAVAAARLQLDFPKLAHALRQVAAAEHG